VFGFGAWMLQEGAGSSYANLDVHCPKTSLAVSSIKFCQAIYDETNIQMTLNGGVAKGGDDTLIIKLKSIQGTKS